MGESLNPNILSQILATQKGVGGDMNASAPQKISRRQIGLEANGSPLYTYTDERGKMVQPNWSGSNYVVEDSAEGKTYNYNKFGGYDEGKSIADAATTANMANEKPKDTSFAQGYTSFNPATGKYMKYNQGAGSFVETAKPDPNAQMAANLDPLAPTTWMDNPIAQFIGLSPEQQALQSQLQQNFQKPVGMSDVQEAAKITKQGAGATDLEGMIRQNIAGTLQKGGTDAYRDAIYEAVAGKLRSEAGRMQNENAAGLAARGLGTSTIVNDVNSAVQRELMGGLGTAANQAIVNAENLRQSAMGLGSGMEQNIAGRQLQGGGQLANIGSQQQNLYNAALNPYQQALQYADANKLMNLGLQNQAWQNKINNAQYLLNLPQAVSTGQNAIMGTGAQIGSNIYAQNNANAAGQNQLAGNVGSMLAKGISGGGGGGNTGYVPLASVASATNNFAKPATIASMPFGAMGAGATTFKI